MFDLKDSIQDLIIDICEVMCDHGYELVSIGAIMRLAGVSPDRSQLFDNEFFKLDDEFKSILKSRKIDRSVPDDVTLH